MAISTKLIAIIEAQDKASSVFKKLNKNTEKTTDQLKKIGIAGVAAASVIGIASIKMSADFSKSMANVSTLLDTNVESMDDMKKEILDLSKRTPVALDDLSAALYAVRSAGISASDAMGVLEESARLGVAGLGTTEEATTLMVLALNNFRDSGLSAKEISDVLFKTVKGGITNISDLAKSFGLVAPLAVEAGVSFQELQAMTAALTQVNKSASISQNQLKASLISLGKPTKEAMELFEKLNVETFAGLITKTGSYMGAINALKGATEGNIETWNKAIGSGEALSAVNALLGAQSDAVTESFEDMTEGANAVNGAFDKQNAEAWAVSQTLRNELNTELIDLGNNILPVLLDIIPLITGILGGMKIAFDEVTDSVSDLIVDIWRLEKEVKKSVRNLGRDIKIIKNYLGFADATDVAKESFSKIQESGESSAAGVSSAYNWAGQSMNDVWGNVKDTGVNAWGAVKMAAGTFVDDLGHGYSAMAEIVNTKTEEIKNNINTKIPEALGGAGSAAKSAKDAFGEYMEGIKKFGLEVVDTIEDITKKINNLEKNLAKLRTGYAKEQNEERMQYAEEYLNQEQRVADAQADINSATTTEAKIEAMNRLAIEQGIFDQYSNFQQKYAEEIAYLRAEDAKSEMQRAVESIRIAGWKAMFKFKEEEKRIKDEIKLEEDRLTAVLKIQAIAIQEHDKFLALQELHAVDSINRQISKYNELAKAIARAAAGRTSSLVGQAAGTIERATQTVEPYQTPQVALAGVGGITVNINGGNYLSEEVAEDIGDKIIDKLKSNIRI